MKTRASLVSNSSSSSFIVIFPRKPKCSDEVFEYMFNRVDGEIAYYDYDKKSYKEISEIVFNDIEKKATVSELENEFYSLMYGEIYDIKESIRKDYVPMMSNYLIDCDWDERINDLIKLLRKELEENINHRRDLDMFYQSHRINSQTELDDKPEIQKETKKLQNKYYRRCAKISDQVHILVRSLAIKKVKEFRCDHKGWWCAVLCYSDENCAGLMEHGNIFRHIEHIKINHH